MFNNSLIFLFIVLTACGTKSSQSQPAINEVKIEEIVLVNAGNADRCEIGRLIQAISKCNPKVVGVNFLFKDQKEPTCDSTLRQSIIESDKVVLVEAFENGVDVKSNKIFSDVSFSTGPTGLTKSDGGVVDYYYRMIDYRGKWELSFPFILALQYDKDRAAELSSKLSPEDYPIIFYHDSKSFTIFNHTDDISDNCDSFNGKILVIGYLGPDDQNVFKTRISEKSSSKTYGTIIIANIVLDILKDLE